MPEARPARYVPNVSEALTNTRRIAKSCYTEWVLKQMIFPSLRQLFSAAAYKMLHHKTHEGAIWRYGSVPHVVRARIEVEPALIREKGDVDYFLVVDEIVRQAPGLVAEGLQLLPACRTVLGFRRWTPFGPMLGRCILPERSLPNCLPLRRVYNTR